jgi:hypothetical protein
MKRMSCTTTLKHILIVFVLDLSKQDDFEKGLSNAGSLEQTLLILDTNINRGFFEITFPRELWMWLPDAIVSWKNVKYAVQLLEIEY